MSNPVNYPVSTVPAVIQYLLTQIQVAANQDPDSGDFLVCLGEPSVDSPAAIIEVAKEIRRVVDTSSFTGGGGYYSFEENYEVDIVVSVAMETVDVQQDPLTLTQRAWQLQGYVETACRMDRSLGGLVQDGYPQATTGGEVVWAENNIGRICELTTPIFCRAVI